MDDSNKSRNKEITLFDEIIQQHVPSESNLREHWTARRRRHSIQKLALITRIRQKKPDITFPCTITFTRISPRALDDDNLPTAFKAIRDALADYIFPGLPPGRADGDKRLSWQYKQEKGPHSYRIEIKAT